MTLTVNADYVSILAGRFVSRDPARPELRGIFAEPRPEGGCLLVASDGFRLGCFYDRAAVCEAPEPVYFAISRFAVTHAATRVVVMREAVHLQTEKGVARSPVGRVLGAPPFPANWRSVLPGLKAKTSPNATFNADFLQAFNFRPWDDPEGATAPRLTLAAGSADTVTAVANDKFPDFFGFLMPVVRMPNAGTKDLVPEWVRNAPPPAVARDEVADLLA